MAQHSQSRPPIRREGVPQVSLDPRKDLCPCGQGKTIRDCCFRNGRLFRASSMTAPPGLRTGYSHEGCYARCLADCDGKLSREHWISESALRLLDPCGPITFEGLGWQSAAKAQTMYPRQAASHVLCRRHNNALSIIDEAGTAFFKALLHINRLQAAEPLHTQNRCLLLSNGHDIERWLLKVLIGGIASGNMRVNGCRQQDWEPIPEYIEFLFGWQTTLSHGGLYIIDPNGVAPPSPGTLNIAPLSRHGSPVGLLAFLAGFQLCLAIGPRDDTPLVNGVFRPKELITETPQGSIVLGISWEVAGDDQGAVLRWVAR